MYGELKDKGFAVLGFPCNDYGGQEPGGPAEIQKCASGYKATFPLFEKIAIKGKDVSPVYAALIAQSKQTPSWNFCKYLVGKSGRVVKFWASKTAPGSPEMREAIDAAIAAS